MKHQTAITRYSLLALALITSAGSILSGCSSQPVVPEAKNVKVAREDAGKNCEDLGPVEGTVKTHTGTVQDAIEDMKLDAARKGANYVRMETAGAMGTSVRGTAYQCK